MNRIILGLALALSAAASASAAPSPCGGRPPADGDTLRGPVLHVLDGRTLCVATGVDPAEWVALTLRDAPASTSWGGLMSVAFGKDVTCILSGPGREAECRLDGRPLGPQLGDARVAAAGLAWRAHAAPAPSPTLAPVRIAAAY